MSIQLDSVGGAEEVTGSRHILAIDDSRYLVDCGAFQGTRDEANTKNRTLVPHPETISATILTHAHFDHCGMLPLLGKRGFRGNIFCTPATRDLASLIMMDSASIQQRDAEYLTKQSAKKGSSFDWKPLYDEQDVVSVSDQFVAISYNRPFTAGDGINVEFYDAGHILGSAMACISAKDRDGYTVTIAFTGDLGRKNKPIIRDPALIPAVEYIVLESTYGDRLHESTEDALTMLANVVNDAAAMGGKVIIPSFAVERTQELVYYLHLLVDASRIPSIPIWVDSPMAINATAIFQVHPECYDKEIHEAFIQHHKNPFGFNNLHFSMSVDESKKLNSLQGPAIIISADGMCEAGRIQHHLMHCISDSANTILFVGFMAQHTLGRRILEGEKEVRIHDGWYKVKAKTKAINAFSAHADYSEIGDWLSMLDTSKLKKVFLVHGEDKAREHLKSYLLGQGIPAVEKVMYGKSISL